MNTYMYNLLLHFSFFSFLNDVSTVALQTLYNKVLYVFLIQRNILNCLSLRFVFNWLWVSGYPGITTIPFFFCVPPRKPRQRTKMDRTVVKVTDWEPAIIYDLPGSWFLITERHTQCVKSVKYKKIWLGNFIQDNYM